MAHMQSEHDPAERKNMSFSLSITTFVQNTKKTLSEGKAMVTVWLHILFILMNSIDAHRLQCPCARMCSCK